MGQYQHDVDQKALKERLDDVAGSCVNNVGVELNTASGELLSYVSGLGPRLAKPESTEGGRLVSILKWPEGAPLNLG